MRTKVAPLIKQGWLRALLYVIILALVLALFDYVFMWLVPQPNGNTNVSGGDTKGFLLRYAAGSLGIFLTTYAIRKLVDRASLASLGFEWKGYKNEALLGFFSAPLLLGVGSLVLVIAGFTTFTGMEWQWYPIFLQGLLMLLAAFSEELMLRGYLLNNLLQSANKWVALVITALLFALLHGGNGGLTFMGVLSIFAAGLFLGLNYLYTRNLWFSIAFHFSWNVFQGPVFGYPVSGEPLEGIFKQVQSGPALFTGGSFGFEGSVLCVAFLIASTWYLNMVFLKRYGGIIVNDPAL